MDKYGNRPSLGKKEMSEFGFRFCALHKAGKDC